MPRYIQYGAGGGHCKSSQQCCSASDYESSVNFFSKLSDKLSAMVTTVQTQFNEYKTEIDKFTTPKGIVSKVETPAMVLGVGQEYIIYIQRFGPPPVGIFDPAKLQAIRVELGI